VCLLIHATRTTAQIATADLERKAAMGALEAGKAAESGLGVGTVIYGVR
jgi:hypothetical protein